MKFRTAPNIWHLLGIGLLLTILTASYLMGRPIDSDVHARILDHGRSLIEANANLDEQIVLLRSGLLRHYDPVNETVDNLRRRSAALGIELSKIAGQSTQAIAQALEGVRAAVNAKEEQVERFKSTNALLQNSLMYFSMAAQQLIVVADHTVAGTPITRTTGTLVARMLAYTRAPHEQNTELVRQSLAALEGLALPPKFAQDARLLAQHARAVLDLAPATNSALSNLLAMDVAKRARELLSVYLDQYAAAEQQTQIYRRGSYAVSILLVFYLIFLFARLQTSAQALTRANRALSTQKERAEKTLHAIADGVIATDARGVITDVNTVAEELPGYGQGEAVGRNVRD
ncbi:MAG: PAS domain-containing protein, partial [Pseudomonadota bacterium]